MVPYLYSELRAGAAPLNGRCAPGHRCRTAAAVAAAACARSSSTGCCCFFALYYLMPLFVMLADLVQAAGRDPRRQPASRCRGVRPSSPGARPGQRLRRRRLQRPQAAISGTRQDGGAGGADLDADRRTQRLRAHQVALSRRRHRCSALIMFGCFIPFQIVLIPMAHIARQARLASTTAGLIFVHVVYGIWLHHAVLPQLLRGGPGRAGQGRARSTAPASSRSSGASCCRSRRRSSWSA